MKKKLLPLLLCCTLLAACGDNDGKTVAAETPTPTKAVVSELPSQSDTTVDPLTALQDCLANGRSIPSEAALPEGVSLSPEFLEQALVRNGNTSRLRDVMLKASEGKEITLAYLGGSITAGSRKITMNTLKYFRYYQTHSFPEAAAAGWPQDIRLESENLLTGYQSYLLERKTNSQEFLEKL